MASALGFDLMPSHPASLPISYHLLRWVGSGITRDRNTAGTEPSCSVTALRCHRDQGVLFAQTDSLSLIRIRAGSTRKHAPSLPGRLHYGTSKGVSVLKQLATLRMRMPFRRILRVNPGVDGTHPPDPHIPHYSLLHTIDSPSKIFKERGQRIMILT